MSNKLDLDYRPQSYFWADEIGVLLTSQIKGAQRKALYERFVRDGSEEDIDELLSKPKLSDQERDFIGKIHPSLMGGEYLPESLAGEVEIARITINSTTQDVTSVFASPRENEIYYRVVDEYDGETLTEISEIDGKKSNVPDDTSALDTLLDQMISMEEEKKSGKRHLSVTLNYSCHQYRKSEAGDS
jgi:hypothetical protein